MKALDLTLSSPAENLACDEALLEAAESGECGEVLRFWESPSHFVVVGYSNKIESEVNVATCAARQIPILRRCSGGGTVVQGPGCLNYALVLRIDDGLPTRNISSANQFIMEQNRAAIQSAIADNRSSVSIQGHTDLAIGGLKISGNSQRRRKNFLLFHGTILHHFDLTLIGELLRMPALQPDYRQGRSHSDFVTNIACKPEQLKNAFISAWNATDTSTAPPTEHIAALMLEKYSSPSWNFRS